MNTESPQSERIAESVLSQIKREGITPRPRWHFLLREGCVWSAGAFSVAVGSLAVAGILFEVRHAWWDLYEATHDTFLTFTLDALPFVWIVGFGGFALVAYASVRYTKRGYRYPVHVLLLGSVASSALFGTVLYVVGAGEFVDESVGAYIPMHRSLLERERMQWGHPDLGRIAGVVRDIPYAEGRLWLEGVDDVVYEVDMTEFVPREREQLRIGDHVRVLGVPTTTAGVLHACMVLLKDNDILRRIREFRGVPEREAGKEIGAERNMLFARSSVCKDVRPYVRLAPLQQ